MWRRRHRKRLGVYQPAQHFETRVPVGDCAGGQKWRVGRATYAQQVKVVRRQQLHSPHTAMTVRPPLNLDKNAVVYVVPHEKRTPGVAAATRNGPTIAREGRNRSPPRRGKTRMFDGSRPLWGNSRILKRRVGVGMFQRRSHQPLEPEAITPPKFQAKIHNYAFAHRVPKHRHRFQVSYDLTKGVFHVNAAKDDPSCGTVQLPQNQYS